MIVLVEMARTSSLLSFVAFCSLLPAQSIDINRQTKGILEASRVDPVVAKKLSADPPQDGCTQWVNGVLTSTGTACGGAATAYSHASDGTNASSAVLDDTLKFRSANSSVSITVGDNDPIHGDNVNFELPKSVHTEPFASSTSWSLSGSTHGLSTCDLVVEVWVDDGSGQRQVTGGWSYIRCNPSTYDISVSWPGSTAGRLVVARGAGSGGGGGGGGGAGDAYSYITDGSTTASASGADQVKFRSSDGSVNVSVISNDPTHGDSVDIKLPKSIHSQSFTSSSTWIVLGSSHALETCGVVIQAWVGDQLTFGWTYVHCNPTTFDITVSWPGSTTGTLIIARGGGSGGGGGTPGGSSGQLQYNSSGAFGGVTGSSVSGSTISLTGTLDAGPGSLRTPNGTALPGSCAVGQIFFKSDAPAGQNFYGCTSANTWSLLGDGSGGGVSSVFGRTGAVLAQNGDYSANMVTNAFDTSTNNAIGDNYIDLGKMSPSPGQPSASNLRLYADASTGKLRCRDSAGLNCMEPGGYGTVQEEGSNLTSRSTINFVGAGVTASDDSGNSRTNISLATALNTIAGLSCSLNQIIKWNGSAWTCAADSGGGGGGSFDASATYDLTGINKVNGLYFSTYLQNSSTTGTTLYQTVCINSSGQAIQCSTASAGRAIGICMEGCGVTGNARIVWAGQFSCDFDGSVTAGNWATVSSSAAGKCTDAGTNKPTSPLGIILVTQSGAGIRDVIKGL